LVIWTKQLLYFEITQKGYDKENNCPAEECLVFSFLLFIY
jgi:hypothetical protein